MTRAEILGRLEALRSHVDRELGSILQEVRGSEKRRATVDPDPDAPRPFKGRPLEAKFPGTCCVCGNGFAAGASIIRHAETKKTAHLGCGAPDPRELRR